MDESKWGVSIDKELLVSMRLSPSSMGMLARVVPIFLLVSPWINVCAKGHQTLGFFREVLCALDQWEHRNPSVVSVPSPDHIFMVLQ